MKKLISNSRKEIPPTGYKTNKLETGSNNDKNEFIQLVFKQAT